MKYLIVTELHMDDKVVPISSDPKENGKIFTVTDLHPVRLNDGEYRTVAVTLWDQWREHTSRTMMYLLIERVWN